MLNNEQSLIICGLIGGGIFIFGILDILDNFVVLTILTLLFFSIIINLFYVKSKSKEDIKDQDNTN
jgi:hypothetical protein